MIGKTKSKGSFRPKKVVKCGYREETSRKDNLERPIDTRHPGESDIEVAFGIKNFLKVVETPIQKFGDQYRNCGGKWN